MSFEIVVTSAPSGLKPGAKGYCTVGATKGIAPQVLSTLESLSGYRWLFSASDPRNPVIYSHLLLKSGESILSRIGDAGLDYSNRENKLAHHLVLTDGERPAEGPTRTMAHSTTLIQKWEGDPRYLPQRKILADSEVSGPCRTWAQVTGDAGWAAVLAETVKGGTGREAFIVYRAGIDCLALIDEALSLLHSQERWMATFSTFFTKNVPHHAKCQWRFIEKGQPEEKLIPPSSHAFRLDLTDIRGMAPPDSPLALQARTGVPPKKKLEKAVKPLPVELGFREPKAEHTQSNASSRGVPAGITQPAPMGMSPTLSPAKPERKSTGPFADHFLEATPPAPPDRFPRKKPMKRISLFNNFWTIPVLIAFLTGCFLGLFIGVGTMLAVYQVNDQPPLAANTTPSDKEKPQASDDNSPLEQESSNPAGILGAGGEKTAEALAQAEVLGNQRELDHASDNDPAGEFEKKEHTSIQTNLEPDSTPDDDSQGVTDTPIKSPNEKLQLLVGRDTIELPFSPKDFFFLETPSLNKTKLTDGPSRSLQIPPDDNLANTVDVLRLKGDSKDSISPLPDFEARKEEFYLITNEAEKRLCYFAVQFAVNTQSFLMPDGEVRAEFDLPKFRCSEIRLEPRFDESVWRRVPTPTKNDTEKNPQEKTIKLETHDLKNSRQLKGVILITLKSNEKQIVVNTWTEHISAGKTAPLNRSVYEEVLLKIKNHPIMLSFIFESVEIESETFDIHVNDVPLIWTSPALNTAEPNS
jgi:hypothetical protein